MSDGVATAIMFGSMPVWMGIIWLMARARGRHWAWMFLGVLQIVGLAVALVVIFAFKPAKKGEFALLQERYARGEIGEEEYRRAMTGTDRAA